MSRNSILYKDPTNLSDDDDDDKKITVKELRTMSQRIQWIDLLKAYLPHAYISDNTPIYAPSRKYLTDALSRILSTTDMGSLNSYLIWTLVFKYAPYMSKAYRNAFEPYLRVYTGATQPSPRWEFCIETTNKFFNLALLSLYAQETLPEEKFTEAYDLFNSVRAAFAETLGNVNWMDTATRIIAVNKIKNIDPWVLYRHYVLEEASLDAYYDKLSVSKTDFFLNIQNGGLFRRYQLETAIKNTSVGLLEIDVFSDINAYNSELGLIVVPPIYMQDAVLRSNNPKYLEFGSLGSYIGHGLIHGFEEVGKSFDRSGYKPILWDNKTMVAFADHSRCMWKHFSAMKLNESQSDVNKTLEHSIADVGGVVQAFYAYRTWEEKNGLEPVLPGVTYTPDQMFFVSYAQSMCSATRDEYLETFLQLSDYPPGKTRVTKALSQVPQFADAFKCSYNTLFHPKQRCSMW